MFQTPDRDPLGRVGARNRAVAGQYHLLRRAQRTAVTTVVPSAACTSSLPRLGFAETSDALPGSRSARNRWPADPRSASSPLFANEGIETIKPPVQAPKANAIAERFVGTARAECLDWLLIINRRHLERVLRAHYLTAHPELEAIVTAAGRPRKLAAGWARADSTSTGVRRWSPGRRAGSGARSRWRSPEAGADVALGLRDVAADGGVADEIAALGRRALPLQMDVTRPRAGARAVGGAVAELGRLDVLVNNAGGGAGDVPAEGVCDEPTSTASSSRNLRGTFFRAGQRSARDDRERGSGGSSTCRSQAALVALPGEPVYCVAKAAVSHLTRCLAVEWGEYGITVNAVAPTFIATPGTEPALADPSSAPTPWSGSRRCTGSASRTRWRAPSSSWPRRPRRSSPARRSRSTAAGRLDSGLWSVRAPPAR